MKGQKEMVLKALYLYSDDMRSINVGNEKLLEKKKKKKTEPFS